MIRWRDLRTFVFASRGWRDDRAAQLAEFAISLPLLVFFVVGIFDFSSAFTLKQKLTNIARDAARQAASEPANDVLAGTAAPASVLDAFQIIQGYFIANNLNLCGITSPGPPSGLTWTYSGSGNGCTPPGLTITINRGYFMPSTGATLPSVNCSSQGSGGSGIPYVVATCVSIQYAYPWKFGRAANVMGTTQILPSQIAGTAIAMNEN